MKAEKAAGASESACECPLCGGTGTLLRRSETGELLARDCVCELRRRSWRRIERSGLRDLLEACTFERYETPEEWQRRIKASAEAYAEDPDGRWFFVGGASGTGKTHLCTAICGALMERGLPCRYMQWRADSTALKGKLRDEAAYAEAMGALKRVRVLYIDDLFKGGATAADVRMAFELLNARYIRREAVTILSTEYTSERLMEIDAALGGRIAERAGAYAYNLEGKRNWRLRRWAR